MSDKSKNPVPASTMILDLLQQAVDAETSSRNLYWARSLFWHNKGFKPLARYYRKQSEEDHAKRNAERLLFLGGDLTIGPADIASVNEPTLRDQFGRDLEVEIALGEFYTETIGEQVLDPVTEDLWYGLLKSTQKHIAWLMRQLCQMDAIGDENYLQTWI
jgi:bacterioferritin (cytochrome b1)